MMPVANGPSILYPMFALAALTALVQLLIPFVRFRAGLLGQITMDDFLFGESSAVPSPVSVPNRNYMNLLEFPVLLYVVCLLAYVAAQVTPVMVTCAWVFVALRVVHSVIHLSYNKVMHRALVFGLSNVVLVALWVQVALQVVSGRAH